ncbi:uncharacterized protein AMSG_11623 [Thecamonas trahens ATCC 50062]|uniref:Uncharacterized protein n=1 Tax=Thecamonas trahens ATCC 50062 TaxID=461836 RepID=A0A0L0DEF2_THETB|nr:hypothetical protein AMSG_11623 [Thecamonas trahens ATCC 50062]KNC50679.1 hypothetical protein AMSG_11623 [Thecamonas trahens ATCC 50062]|eukprot:XP_013762602.1 hypothetical protein AMSG_11623 [Thecamonas trahens ATCC 50062]
MTALHVACGAESRSLAIVKWLVEAGAAAVEARSEKGITPLHVAAIHGRPEVVRWLVESTGARVDTVEENSRTALALACVMGQIEVVRCINSLSATRSLQIDDRIGRHGRASFTRLRLVDMCISYSTS